MDVEALYGPGGPLFNKTETEQAEILAQMVYGVDKGMSLGPYLMGFVIDMFCCGVLVTQFFRWMGHSKDDRVFTKIIVYATFVVSITYSTYAIVYHMQNWVYHFGEYASFAKLIRMMPFVVGDAVTAVTVQIFYAERAYRLLGPQRQIARLTFLFLVIVSMLLEMGGALAGVIQCSTKVKLLFDAYIIQDTLYFWLGGQLAADLLITSTSAWVLWKSKTGWSNTDKIINKLVAFIVETQLPPTLIALIYMIYYSQEPQGTLIIALSTYAMCKPYVIGLLALLNDKMRMRQEMETFHTRDQHTFKSTRHQQATVHVLTETYAESHPAAQLTVGLNRQLKADEYEMDDKEFKDAGSDYAPSKIDIELGNTSRTRLTNN